MNKRFSRIIQVYDFYRNEELSRGFDSGIFKNGISEEWLMGRLQRAIYNEAEDNLLHSRYAIWSTSACDLLNEALEAIRTQDDTKAIRLLELTKRSLMAYTDSQAVFDMDEHGFVQPSSLFHSYATHLLSLDDDKSEILNRHEIVRRLKRNSGVGGVGLPRDIDVSIKNGVLRFGVHATTKNMQEDSAAFEGWILVLKSWLSNEIKYVELDFTVPEVPAMQCGNPQAGHYNRFLYRLNNMLRLFPDWFFVEESKRGIVLDFMHWLESAPCLLNHSQRERTSIIGTKSPERQIESWFAFEEGKDLLCDRWGIDEGKLFNQLPIGVFYGSIAAPNAIFNRGPSALDLWGVSRDSRDLHLIELKCGDNKGIGVISEVLLYISVIYDTCVSEKPLFTLGRYKNAKDTKDMLALQNSGQRFHRLMAHVLVEKFHPLFNPGVESLIAEGLSSLDIGFDRALYDYSKKVLLP